jgi:O-acetyl-ADP-ribose deacetylase (regulator of RNase III)
MMRNPKISIIQGDITKLQTDAIVNAANHSLLGGGGVDGAIHRAAGPELLEECRTLGGCPTGEARITKGYNLQAKYVIHTVGPVYGKDPANQEKQLANCYLSSLELAVRYNCESIAFPNISTGVYGYPKDEAATIACRTVNGFLDKNTSIKEVIFVCFDDENFSLYREICR